MRTASGFCLCLLMLAGWAGFAAGAEEKTDNLPQLKQGSFVESYSPTEWMIRAAGIGSGGKRAREMNALDDARKCAVYFCLYLGTDPLLGTDPEKQRFAPIEQEFFDIKNVMKYIAWESEEFSQRVKTADGKQLKIEKTFRVNVGLLKEDLIAKGVLMATADLAVEMGLPQILVIPEVPKGENPLEAMERQPELKHATRSIESYLTARRYEVIVPEQQEFLNNYGETLRLIEGDNEDLSYKMALAIGSDVYVTFAVSIDRSYMGSTENKKASVSVRAFETTTGRLLGSETGYSFERPAPDEVVTEEAVHDAIDKVLARVNAYWKEDLQRGVQYKVIFNIAGDFDRGQIEKIQNVLSEVISNVSKLNKENVATDKTVEYLVWAKPERYARARELYQDIRDQFDLDVPGAALERQQLNRKLLLLQIVSQ